jgi:parallel beta-helix repeat protein
MNRRVFSIPVVFVMVLALALAMPVSAAGGKGKNVLLVGPGQQYATIQAAVNAAKQGSKILVYPGIYNEKVSISVDNLQIIAQGENVVVLPPDTAGFQVNAKRVTIQGFEIKFGSKCASGIRFEGSNNTFADNIIQLYDPMCMGAAAIVCADPDGGSDFNIVERNTIDGGAKGIVIQANAINTGNIIRDNTLLHIDSVPIAIDNGKGFLVSGNQIEGASIGVCISVGAQSGNELAQGYHTIVKNTMHDCFEKGISLHAWPGTVLTHNRIDHNTIQGCALDCLALQAGSGAALTNNEVSSNSVSFSMGANGILLAADQGGSVSNNLIRDNLVYHNRENGISLTSGANHNRILNNEVQTNRGVGLAIAGDDNLIVGNWAHDNTLDIADLGKGNLWRKNTYTPGVGWAIGWDNTDAAAIVHTTDGGLTWQAQVDSSAWPSMHGNDISAVDDQTAWAALGNQISGETQRAILHTTDGGATWVAQTIPTGVVGEIQGVKGLSRTEAWAASLSGTILHTTDGGVTWNVVPHPTVPMIQVNRIDALSDGNIWVADVTRPGGEGYMIHSSDNGLTWRQEHLPDVYFGAGPLAVSAYSSMVAWGAVNGLEDLWRTVDGGDQWLKVFATGMSNDFDDLCAVGAEAVWGVMNQGLSGKIYRVQVAPDGSFDAQTFDPAAMVYSYEGVTCQNERIAWAVGLQFVNKFPDLPLGVLVFTVDGGEHWVQGTGPTNFKYWKVSFVGARR